MTDKPCYKTLGWMYAQACVYMDKGIDIREVEVPEIHANAKADFAPEPKYRACKVCYSIFEVHSPERREQKYCSDACKAKAYRKRVKERKK